MMLKSEIKLSVFIFILCVMAFLAALTGGYLYYSAVKKEARVVAHIEAEDDLNIIADHIISNISWSHKAAQAMARFTETEQFFINKNTARLSAVNSVLDDFNHTLQADVCYLMDHKGKTLASSNRKAADSYVDQNYAFRPYFKQAMKGVPTVYMALGVISQKRGLYFSHPVYGPDRKTPIGVAVIKVSIELIETIFKRHYDGILVLIDPLGVIFASNRADWLFSLLWKMPAGKTAEIVKTRQFGQGPFQWSGMNPLENRYAVDKIGNTYRVHRYPLSEPSGWQLIYLHDDGMIFEKSIAPINKSIGSAVLISLIVFGGGIFFLYRKIHQEILRRTKAEESLRDSEERLRVIFETIPDPIAMYDIQGQPKYLNSSFSQIFGWSFNELRNLHIPFVPQDQKKKADTIIKQLLDSDKPVRMESKMLTKSGKLLDVHISAGLTKNSHKKSMGIVFNFTDMTERKKLERDREKLIQKLEKLSRTDSLTGFNNRRYFNDAARELFKLSIRHQWPLSALMMDIDYFKHVNDTYGHDIGDAVLQKVAQTCQQLTRETDLSARYGGEEFCFLFPETSSSEALIVAEKLRASIAELEIEADDQNFSITASFGLSTCNHNEDSLESLIKRSDEALYQAKRNGRNRVVTKA